MKEAMILGAAALLLAGCQSMAQIRDQAIADARNHCTKEGKVFALKGVEVKDPGFFDSGRVVVSGYCVKPGEAVPADATPDKTS